MPLVSTPDPATTARHAAAEEIRRAAAELNAEADRLRDRAARMERSA